MREPAARNREPQGQTVGEAPTEYWRQLARNLAVAAAAGAFLALVNAFDMGDAPLSRRLLYWVPLMVIGALLGGGFANLAARIPAARQNLWLLGALITLGLAVVGSGFIWFYTELFWQGGAPSIESLPYFFFTVLVVAAAMTAIMIAINRPGALTHATPADAPVRFLERLPPKLRGAALYAIEAEDHYLRLHTSKGGDLILLRLSDAIAELEGLEGAQTHRSWWVAKDAVEAVARDGARVTLKLKGGAVAPVSRPNVRALKAAGWF